MTRIALLADVHGNLEALERVREDIAAHAVERVVCLGDLTSYNADQHACMELVVADGMQWIAGNHDLIAARLLSPAGCGAAARYSAIKARRELDPVWRDHIRRLPLLVEDEALVAFHASLRRVDEYLLTERSVRDTMALMTARRFARVAFFGHTHRACVWTRVGERVERREAERVELDEGDVHLVNVGTVGEPRDGSRHATYVVLDTGTHSVEFRRVAYDYNAARRKSECGGWRRARPTFAAVRHDRVLRGAGRLRQRLFPRPTDDASLESVRLRQARQSV